MRVDKDFTFEGQPKAKVQRACQQTELVHRVEAGLSRTVKHDDGRWTVKVMTEAREGDESPDDTERRAELALEFLKGFVFGS